MMGYATYKGKVYRLGPQSSFRRVVYCDKCRLKTEAVDETGALPAGWTAEDGEHTCDDCNKGERDES